MSTVVSTINTGYINTPGGGAYALATMGVHSSTQLRQRTSTHLQSDGDALGERAGREDDVHLRRDARADDEAVGADVVRLLADAADHGEVARQVGRQDARRATLLRRALSRLYTPAPTASSTHLFFRGGGEFSPIPPPQKKLQYPPNCCQIVCSKSFFSARTMNYKYIVETFF